MPVFKESDNNSSHWNYPQMLSELTLAGKRAKAEELFDKYMDKTLLTYAREIPNICQDDFKLSSLLGYKVAAAWFEDKSAQAFSTQLFGGNALYMPVRYCGGDMCYGRVFAINHCAFSSADSIIGFRNSESNAPQQYFKIAKGLKNAGTYKNWVLFKLDKSSTDDMTGMLYSALEKNFTIEFAHFPHDGAKRILFRWTDC